MAPATLTLGHVKTTITNAPGRTMSAFSPIETVFNGDFVGFTAELARMEKEERPVRTTSSTSEETTNGARPAGQ